ncbi:transposase [Bradyrhizobium sp. CIR3A]|uniref:IS110 family transposase n=1 Tax=Bradyrhizobium sp. CIR3A TaxID=2663838 RepID=UPI001FEE203A
MCQSGGVEHHLREASVSEVITIGLDIAKPRFSRSRSGWAGSSDVQQSDQPRKAAGFLRGALEACGGAHHWARQLTQRGHEVRLIPPAYVKPFVKRQESDAIDAEAICEAAQRPSMWFVAVKSEQQQAAGLLFRTRDLLVRQRTQLSTRSGGTSLNMVGLHPKGRRMWRCLPTWSTQKRWPARFPKRPTPCFD